MIRDIKESAKAKCLTKEETAYQLQVPVYQGENVFRKLNCDGILLQAIHGYAHDTSRDSWTGGQSGWQADFYNIIEKEEKI